MPKPVSNLQLKYKFWIETEEQLSILGDGKWLLLKAIRDKGSLKSAVEEMGYAYRQTWDNLKKIEKRLGFALIKKTRGGASGGYSELTHKGKQLVMFFEKIHNQINPAIEAQLSSLEQELNAIIIPEESS